LACSGNMPRKTRAQIEREARRASSALDLRSRELLRAGHKAASFEEFTRGVGQLGAVDNAAAEAVLKDRMAFYMKQGLSGTTSKRARRIIDERRDESETAGEPALAARE
jgi:hypothetical protein